MITKDMTIGEVIKINESKAEVLIPTSHTP